MPGGTVDPPLAGAELTPQSLRRHAALELGEEVGAPGGPLELSVWTAVRCPNGNIGVLFRAPGRPWETLRAGFEELRRSERTADRESEFVEVAVIAKPQDLKVRQPVADYLPAAVDLFFTRSGVLTE